MCSLSHSVRPGTRAPARHSPPLKDVVAEHVQAITMLRICTHIMCSCKRTGIIKLPPAHRPALSAPALHNGSPTSPTLLSYLVQTCCSLPCSTSMPSAKRHGSGVGLSGEPTAFRQFRAIATMRAMVVFPIPRCPSKMYPCAIGSGSARSSACASRGLRRHVGKDLHLLANLNSRSIMSWVHFLECKAVLEFSISHIGKVNR